MFLQGYPMVKLAQKIRKILSIYPFKKQNSLTEKSGQSRVDKFFKKVTPLTAEPVQNLDDLRACYRILYKQYLKRNYCRPNINKIYYNIYSLLPDSRTFAIKQNEIIVGTATLVVDSSQLLPMDTLFANELNVLRQENRKLAEVSMLAFDQCAENEKTSGSLTHFEKQQKLFSLFKLIFEYAYYVEQVNNIIIGVHPRHTKLYDYLLFKPLSRAKAYPGACGSLAVPMHLNLDKINDKAPTQLMKSFLFPKTPKLFLKSGLRMSAELIHDLLINDFDFWNDFPGHKQKYLKNFYPQLMFAA